MFILGLTGSIGMGKSVAATDFRRLGLPVHDSDKTVHQVMKPGGAAVQGVQKIFPDCVQNGTIDRQALGKRVFADAEALRRLERVLHPLVRKAEHRFLAGHARLRTPAVVLDIPLLFETGGENRCDAVCVVSAPYREQRRRVLSRPGMTEEKFQNILTHQISDSLKRRAADFVVYTGLGHAFSLRQIARIAKIATTNTGQAWSPRH